MTYGILAKSRRVLFPHGCVGDFRDGAHFIPLTQRIKAADCESAAEKRWSRLFSPTADGRCVSQARTARRLTFGSVWWRELRVHEVSSLQHDLVFKFTTVDEVLPKPRFS